MRRDAVSWGRVRVLEVRRQHLERLRDSGSARRVRLPSEHCGRDGFLSEHCASLGVSVCVGLVDGWEEHCSCSTRSAHIHLSHQLSQAALGSARDERAVQHAHARASNSIGGVRSGALVGEVDVIDTRWVHLHQPAHHCSEARSRRNGCGGNRSCGASRHRKL